MIGRPAPSLVSPVLVGRQAELESLAGGLERVLGDGVPCAALSERDPPTLFELMVGMMVGSRRRHP